MTGKSKVASPRMQHHAPISPLEANFSSRVRNSMKRRTRFQTAPRRLTLHPGASIPATSAGVCRPLGRGSCVQGGSFLSPRLAEVVGSLTITEREDCSRTRQSRLTGGPGDRPLRLSLVFLASALSLPDQSFVVDDVAYAVCEMLTPFFF